MFKGCVRQNSPHHQLWQDAIKTFKSIIFIQHKKTGNKIKIIEMSVPTVKNFIKTIEGMQLLWKILSTKHRLNCMFIRNFNQD